MSHHCWILLHVCLKVTLLHFVTIIKPLSMLRQIHFKMPFPWKRSTLKHLNRFVSSYWACVEDRWAAGLTELWLHHRTNREQSRGKKKISFFVLLWGVKCCYCLHLSGHTQRFRFRSSSFRQFSVLVWTENRQSGEKDGFLAGVVWMKLVSISCSQLPFKL